MFHAASTPAFQVLPAVAPQFVCTKEEDPFASFCADMNQFLKDAFTNRVDGKVDRTNLQVKSDLRNIIFVMDSSPDRFIALVANDVAFQNALAALPKTPDNSPASVATLTSANENRPDKQTEAPAKSSGTTDLVEKAGLPAIMAFALESGALTRTINGNGATLSGNLDGLLRVLTGRQVLCFDCPGALGTPFVRDLGISASFLVNQQNTTAVPTVGPANPSTPSTVTSVNIPSSVGKLSSISARYQVWNPYDPRSPKFLQAWTSAVTQSKKEIDSASQDLQKTLMAMLVNNPIKSDTTFQGLAASFVETFCQDADTANLPKLRQDFITLFNLTVATARKDDPQFNQKVGDASISLAQYKNLWNKILDNAKGKPLLTFEYVFSKPQTQPNTHDLRVILGYTPTKGVGLLSINAGVSLYETVPTGAQYGRLHDGQISAEYDRPFMMTSNRIPATFSLAAYWQYQPDPGVLNINAGNLAPGTNILLPGNAQVLLGTAGSLWVTQAKLAINAKSGIKVPIAVKWSNKTDLLSGNKIGALIGVSYDFSTLSTLFGGQQ
jgi:hypothetical protein